MRPRSSSWPARIYYDGSCAICAASATRIQARDVHRRLSLVDIAAAAFDPRAEGIDPARAQQLMHARLADGRLLTGADAVLAVAEALPSLWILRWAGRVPGIRTLARPLYRWVARNRYRLGGRCRHSACSAPAAGRASRGGV